MKKITLTLAFLFSMVMGGYGQVTVGEGTNMAQPLPINTYYGYTYSQSIYLSSEINASGTITTLQWYFGGSSDLANNQALVIYFGQTDKTAFDSNTDFIPVDELTQVYAGGIVTGSTAGWKTITLTTPFVYDNISNLVIAVDENTPNYNLSTDDFYNTAVGANRSIYSYSDSVNTDPLDPANDQGGFPTRGRVGFVPNIILGGIQQACPNVTAITAAEATTTQATIGWTAVDGQTEWEVYVVEQGSDAPTSTTIGASATGTPSYIKTDLLSNTAYSAYVRAKCSDVLYSGWAGPKNFRTLCDPFGDFEENMDEITAGTGVVPNCWTKTIVSTNTNVNVSVINYSASSTPNAIYMTNSNDETAQILLVTPALTSIGDNTHRMKFKARAGSADNPIIIGTMTDPTNAATFTALQTINLTTTYTTYSISMNNSTTDNFIAFKHGQGGTYRSLYIDDVVWEPIPTSPPGCVDDMDTVINEGCGNFPTTFTWAAVEGADGYTISIGTSTNGQDLIVDNVNLNNALNYSFTGTPGTMYYYTVTPYNAFGPAVDCFEDNFTTYEDGCYCTSVPTSNDGAGITGVQINDTFFENEDVTYYDFTEEGAIDIARGVNAIVNITFATGYTYGTNIWIDYNDNYVFEASEKVFSGESLADNPTVLNANFLTELTANLGEHRMRIGSADTGQATPNPCFGGSYGVTLDFMVNVIEAPACLPPTASNVSNITANTAQVNWTSEGTLFNVEYDYAGFTQGGGTVISGIAANSTDLPSLDAQTEYSYYIQTDCGNGSLSPWTGPFTFKTACDAFGDFTENFTTEVNISAPECWYTLRNSTSTFSNIQIYNYNDYVQFYNSDDANAALYLITPALIDLPSGTYRTKFKAYSYATGAAVIVGTMSDPTSDATFTAVETIPLTSSWVEYAVSFATTTDQYVAFKFVGTGTYQYMYMDDVIWEPAPTTAPDCATDINAEINTECGNYATEFTWSAVEGADSYILTIGTATGEGTPIVLGNVTSYSFTGDFDTTYYYTLVPNNAFGPAVGCVEGTFTTYSDGCYCPSIPTSNDNSGITNITINESEFANEDVTYTDFSGDEDVIIYQGQLANVQVTFGTGYTYNTYLFIDFNDNYVFEPTEQVFSGESLSANPTIYDASFTLADDATLGVHRMRLVTYDYNATPAVGNPCYSSSYGVTADFNVSVQDFLSAGQFENNSFSIYPNPVKDVLNVNTTQNISDVTVYNLLGQQVLFMNMNTNQGKIDMSNLASGTYLVKVNTETAVKTIKVIKQ